VVLLLTTSHCTFHSNKHRHFPSPHGIFTPVHKNEIGRGVRQGCCLSPILFNLYSEYLTKEAQDGLGDFNIGGQIIQTVKYAYDLVLMAKEETVLRGMIDKLIETGRYPGTEMNVEKSKSNENFKTTIPSNNYDRPKTTGECEMF